MKWTNYNKEDIFTFSEIFKRKTIEYIIFCRIGILSAIVLRMYLHNDSIIFERHYYLLLILYFLFGIYITIEIYIYKKHLIFYLSDRSIEFQFYLDIIFVSLFYITTLNPDSDAFLFFALPIFLLSQKKYSNDYFEFIRTIFLCLLLFIIILTIQNINNYFNIKGSSFDLVIIKYYTPKAIFIIFMYGLTRLLFNSKKNTESLLNETNAILNGVGESVFAIDEEHNIKWINENLKEKYQKKHQKEINIINKKCYTVFRERNNVCIDCISDSAMNERKRQNRKETWRVNGIKTIFYVTAAPVISDNNVIGAVETLLDITEEEKLLTFKEQHSNLVKIIESTTDSIILTDEKGKILISNKGAAELLDYTLEEFENIKAQNIYSDENGDNGYQTALNVIDAINKSDNGRIFNYSTFFTDKHDKIIPISLSATSIYDDADKSFTYVGIGRDMTEYNKIKDNLIIEKQINAENAFNSFLVHAVKNKITALTINITRLRKNLAYSNIPEPDRQAFQNCINILGWVKKKISEFLYITSTRNSEIGDTSPILNLQIISANNLLNAIFNHIDHYTNLLSINIKQIDITEDLQVKVDIDKILHIIDTIIENSFEAQSNTIDIKISFISEYLTFEFIDNGIGISNEVKMIVFSQRITTKNDIPNNIFENTGLGLLRANQYMIAQKGSINFDNDFDNGSKVILKIPQYYN